MVLRPRDEGRVLHRVGEVVAQRVGPEDRGRERWHLAMQAGRGRVDHHVVAPAAEFLEFAGEDLAEHAEIPGHGLGALARAVGDRDVARIGVEERRDDAAGRATRAEDQDPGTGEPRPQVLAQVVHEAHAIGVVAFDGAIRVLDQRVHGTRQFGARGQPGGQFQDLRLVGHRDVQAAESAGEELPHPIRKLLRRDVDGLVAQVLPGRIGKQAVDDRRFAVRDRVADDAITVRHVLFPTPGCLAKALSFSIMRTMSSIGRLPWPQ